MSIWLIKGCNRSEKNVFNEQQSGFISVTHEKIKDELIQGNLQIKPREISLTLVKTKLQSRNNEDNDKGGWPFWTPFSIWNMVYSKAYDERLMSTRN